MSNINNTDNKILSTNISIPTTNVTTNIVQQPAMDTIVHLGDEYDKKPYNTTTTITAPKSFVNTLLPSLDGGLTSTPITNSNDNNMLPPVTPKSPGGNENYSVLKKTARFEDSNHRSWAAKWFRWRSSPLGRSKKSRNFSDKHKYIPLQSQHSLPTVHKASTFTYSSEKRNEKAPLTRDAIEQELKMPLVATTNATGNKIDHNLNQDYSKSSFDYKSHNRLLQNGEFKKVSDNYYYQKHKRAHKSLRHNKPCCQTRLPQLFERAAPTWWNPRFDSDILETQLKKTSIPLVKRQFRIALCFVSLSIATWSAYMGSVAYANRWIQILIGSSLLLALAFASFFATFTRVFDRHYGTLSMFWSITICVLSLFTFSRPRGGYILSPVPVMPTDQRLIGSDATLSYFANFATSLQVIVLLYTFTNAPMLFTAGLALSYSIIFITLSAVRLAHLDRIHLWALNENRLNIIKLIGFELILHFCLHILGLHIFLMRQVRLHSTFWQIGQSLIAKKSLELERKLKEKIIHSVMPPSVADELMQPSNEEEMSSRRRRKSSNFPLWHHHLQQQQHRILAANLGRKTAHSNTRRPLTAVGVGALFNDGPLPPVVRTADEALKRRQQGKGGHHKHKHSHSHSHTSNCNSRRHNRHTHNNKFKELNGDKEIPNSPHLQDHTDSCHPLNPNANTSKSQEYGHHHHCHHHKHGHDNDDSLSSSNDSSSTSSQQKQDEPAQSPLIGSPPPAASTGDDFMFMSGFGVVGSSALTGTASAGFGAGVTSNNNNRPPVVFRPFKMNKITNVSILFADIVGFTQMSSNKSAATLVALLNDLFGRFDKLCEACGCEKIATLGDCYYCVSGCPEPRADHAICCVRMGLSMIRAIKEFDRDNNQSVNMRVGIHTGTVLCGVVGTRRFKFDVWSNDVTLANKLESTGKPGRVHISQTTLDALSDKYVVEPGDDTKEGMKTYFIIKPKSPRDGPIIAAITRNMGGAQNIMFPGGPSTTQPMSPIIPSSPRHSGIITNNVISAGIGNQNNLASSIIDDRNLVGGFLPHTLSETDLTKLGTIPPEPDMSEPKHNVSHSHIKLHDPKMYTHNEYHGTTLNTNSVIDKDNHPQQSKQNQEPITTQSAEQPLESQVGIEPNISPPYIPDAIDYENTTILNGNAMKNENTMLNLTSNEQVPYINMNDNLTGNPTISSINNYNNVQITQTQHKSSVWGDDESVIPHSSFNFGVTTTQSPSPHTNNQLTKMVTGPVSTTALNSVPTTNVLTTKDSFRRAMQENYRNISLTKDDMAIQEPITSHLPSNNNNNTVTTTAADDTSFHHHMTSHVPSIVPPGTTAIWMPRYGGSHSSITDLVAERYDASRAAGYYFVPGSVGDGTTGSWMVNKQPAVSLMIPTAKSGRTGWRKRGGFRFGPHHMGLGVGGSGSGGAGGDTNSLLSQKYLQKQQKYDIHLVNCIKEDALNNKKNYFSNPPINWCCLTFKDRDLEYAYRHHLFTTSPFDREAAFQAYNQHNADRGKRFGISERRRHRSKSHKKEREDIVDTKPQTNKPLSNTITQPDVKPNNNDNRNNNKPLQDNTNAMIPPGIKPYLEGSHKSIPIIDESSTDDMTTKGTPKKIGSPALNIPIPTSEELSSPTTKTTITKNDKPNKKVKNPKELTLTPPFTDNTIVKKGETLKSNSQCSFPSNDCHSSSSCSCSSSSSSTCSSLSTSSQSSEESSASALALSMTTFSSPNFTLFTEVCVSFIVLALMYVACLILLERPMDAGTMAFWAIALIFEFGVICYVGSAEVPCKLRCCGLRFDSWNFCLRHFFMFPKQKKNKSSKDMANISSEPPLPPSSDKEKEGEVLSPLMLNPRPRTSVPFYQTGTSATATGPSFGAGAGPRRSTVVLAKSRDIFNRWWVRQVFGLVIASLPAASLLIAYFRVSPSLRAAEAQFYDFLLALSLLHLINLVQLLSWIKALLSLLVTGVIITFVSLEFCLPPPPLKFITLLRDPRQQGKTLAAHLYYYFSLPDRRFNNVFTRISDVAARHHHHLSSSNHTLSADQQPSSPTLFGSLRTGNHQNMMLPYNLTPTTGYLNHSLAAPMKNLFNILAAAGASETAQTTPNSSLAQLIAPLLTHNYTNGSAPVFHITEDGFIGTSSNLARTASATGIPNFCIEMIISVLLILLLVIVLNREFEINYRLNFKGRDRAQRDKEIILVHKNQAEWLLHNIIPKHVVEQLKETSKYSRNHKNVGIIFATIVNFNELYDESFEGGKECLRVLNEVIGDFDELLDKPEYREIEKIKTIGSTFMAAGGLNTANTVTNDNAPSYPPPSTTVNTDLNKVVEKNVNMLDNQLLEPIQGNSPSCPQVCLTNKREQYSHLISLMDFAFDMLNVVDNFNRDLLEFNFILRIGYNVGDVTAGVIGTTKLYYDIWGDAVNIASRMDSTGVPNRIQVPAHVVPMLQDFFEFEYRGEVYAKGKGQVATYLVKGRL